MADLVANLVLDVITDHLFTGIGHRAATGFGGGVGVVGLHVALHLIAGVTACGSAGHGGDLLAGTTTNLVTEQAAGQGTHQGAGDLVLILHRLLLGHRHVFAHLPRGLDGLLDRLHRQDLRILGRAVDDAVGRHCATGSHAHRTQHRTYQH